jgi:hypothetical protein
MPFGRIRYDRRRNRISIAVVNKSANKVLNDNRKVSYQFDDESCRERKWNKKKSSCIFKLTREQSDD